MKNNYKRKVDRKMKDSGETDFEKKKIRVNPKKKDLLNTVIHEELHRKYPDKPEKWIKEKAAERESNISVREAIKLLKPYVKGKKK